MVDVNIKVRPVQQDQPTQISTVNAQGQSVTTLATHGFQALSAQGKSTFTKTVTGVDANGNPVTTTTTQTVQNVNLTSNSFYREFSDNPAVTAQAAALPQMQGAGLVRDLREAMSLVDANGQATAQSSALEQTLNTFKAATTAQSRQNQVDAVIAAWANTSSMGDAMTRNPIPANASNWHASSVGQAISVFAQSQPALYAQLSILERFNAQPVIERYTRANSSYYYDPAQARYVGYTYYTVSIEGQRLPFFQSAYDSLKASTYQSLYLQTEGKDLLATKLPCRHQRRARNRGKSRDQSGLSPRGVCVSSYRKCSEK